MKKKRFETIFLFIISIISILVGCVIVFCIIPYQSYVSVEATVIQTYIESGLGQGGTDSASKYAILEYQHNGKVYTYKKGLGMFENFDDGDKVWIKCNPEDYGDVANEGQIVSLFIVEGVLVPCIIIGILAMKRQKKYSLYV